MPKTGGKSYNLSPGSMPSIMVYILVNTLFVAKYSPVMNNYLSIGYALLTTAGMVALYSERFRSLAFMQSSYSFKTLALLLVIFVIFLLFILAPESTAVTRAPAINEWLDALAKGKYPYDTSLVPSGFPMLFIVAWPFKLMGDVGLLQAFSAMVFASVLFLLHGQNSPRKTTLLILFIASPLVAYEIVTRSDIVSNMILVAAYFYLVISHGNKASMVKIVTLGALGGLVLSTRAVAGIALLPLIAYMLRRNFKSGLLFAFAMGATFMATLLPFYLWNPEEFMKSGPFTVQSGYTPLWVVSVGAAFTFLLGFMARNITTLYRGVGLVLFGIVAYTFGTHLIDDGWNLTVQGDRFDLAYFGFCLPFILLSIERAQGE